MRKTYLFLAALLAFSAVSANDKTDSLKQEMEAWQKIADSIEATMHYKTGKISLAGGSISMDIPANFKFLESADARRVIEDLWGNPPSKDILGLLMPASMKVAEGGYSFIVYFQELGYVKDDDAGKIDYDELFQTMKKDNAEENVERGKLNLSPLNLVGWAAKPYYDKDRKVLHWAKEYQVPGEETNTLNYDIRVLGRKGVLNLQAVASMEELDSVNAHINDVLAMVSFAQGSRYSDFNSSTDEVAAWTIGGLVAGKVLAKVGFFAIILKYLKLIIAGIVLAAGAIWRFVAGRRKKEQDLTYQPSPVSNPTQDPTDPTTLAQ